MSLFIEVVIIGLLVGGVYAMLSVGLTLIFGVMRIIDFAYGDCVVLGMYGTLLFHEHVAISPYLTALIIAPVFFVGGALVYGVVLLPLAKREDAHLNQTIVTLGLSLIVLNLLTLRSGSTSRVLTTALSTSSIEIGAVSIRVVYAVGFGLAVAITLALWMWLRYTRAGKGLRAVAQDRTAAELLGISPHRSEMMSFGIGTALAGVAGAVMIPFYSVTPQADVPLALIAYVTIVLGGLGSVPGAVVGGLIIGLVESLTSYYVNSELSTAFYLAVFVLVLIVRPNGLFGSRAWGVRAQ
jgi:branched-chain amino acid transport system permease protein